MVGSRFFWNGSRIGDNKMNAPQTNTIELNELPEGAEVVVFGHRSGAETHQSCPRKYYLNYLYLGRGITQSPGPLYFAVGTAVHHGLACMLLEKSIDECIQTALDSLHDSGAYAAIQDIDTRVEQDVLVEGLLYAFYRYALPGLLADFEVITVEVGAVDYIPIDTGDNDYFCLECKTHKSEGDEQGSCHVCGSWLIKNSFIAIQSRPDAILRNRRTNEVCGISWKTIDDPSDMRRSQLVNDLQGFMELYYGEKILEKMAGAPVTLTEIESIMQDAIKAMREGQILATLPDFIRDMTAIEERARAARNIPTTIDYIQTIFLVKGPRRLLDENETPEWSVSGEVQDEYGGYAPGKKYRQMSHLCYRYVNTEQQEMPKEIEYFKSGPRKGQPKPADKHDPNLQGVSWAYRFKKPGNASFSALSTKWMSTPIQQEEIRDWVDALLAGDVYPSTMGCEENPNPIAKVIRFEEPMYRNQTLAAAHVDQQQERFIHIARAKNEMDDLYPEPIETLNTHFPQHLISCKTPYKCQFHQFCHGAQADQLDFQTVPEGFELRVPHHEAERKFLGVEE